MSSNWNAKLISIVLVSITLGISGCSTATSKLKARNKINNPNSRVFFAKYDEVEAALKLALIKYPQRVDNSDAGILETDFLRGDARFVPAHAPETRYSNGYKYKILVRVIRGRAEKPATKVLVTKQVELARDFFAPPEQATSDGLEESAILYRIGREITIARALAKAGETPAAPTVSQSH